MESSILSGTDEEQAPTSQESILSRLRTNREEIRQSKYLDLDIPGYEDLLYARYTTVPFKTFEQDEKRRKKSKSADPALLMAAVDQVIACCDQILVRDPGHVACVTDQHGELTELRPIDVDAAAMGSPVRWEPRLADLIGIPPEELAGGTARMVVQRTFCNDAALIFHASKLGVWLRDTTKEVDDDLLGE